MSIFDKPLFIFEMANNHQGSVEHGKDIIESLKQVTEEYDDEFSFAVKFQYRDLDTFIRPDYTNRDDVKNIKRFKDTRLNEEQFLELKKACEDAGMYTICTGFDEESVRKIAKHKYDIIKIASCSFSDWPMLEEVAKTGLRVIASTAGARIEEIDSVVNFFSHRNIPLTLMHCVAEYPTMENHLELNQIDYLKNRYPKINVGYSTHEDPANVTPVMLAVAKGVTVFEKHVGLSTETVSLNSYSASPEQVREWISSASRAFKMCGNVSDRYVSSPKEQSDLAALQRGVFAKGDLTEGVKINSDNVFYAFPCEEGQLLTKQLSKYADITVSGKMIADGSPIYLDDVTIEDRRPRIAEIVNKVMYVLKKSNVTIPSGCSCELSHHYGIDKYEKVGMTLVDCINREYCKKILVVLPGQQHPTHYHKQKEETFTILYGTLDVVCDGVSRHMVKGESMTVSRGAKHSFSSVDGCVFEEISTTHYKDDSFYDKKDEFVNPRKTNIYITAEMIEDFEIN